MGRDAAGPALDGDDLSTAFEHALRPLRETGDPMGILFSAGVDSALLAWELRTRPDVSLCTLGRPRSPDVVAAHVGADCVGLPWSELRLTEAEVGRAEARFAEELHDLAPVSRTVLLALAIAIDLAPPALLVCGQGADELFFGYAHYRDLDERAAATRSDEDLARLRATDWPRTQRIARTAGKTIVAPYLDPAFEAAARQIPIAIRLPGNAPKRFFRDWAMGRGLPRELAARPKKAVQYGTGLDAILRQRRRPGAH